MKAGPQEPRGEGQAAGRSDTDATGNGAQPGNGRVPYASLDEMLSAMASHVNQATEAIRFLGKTVTELRPLLESIREFEDALQSMEAAGLNLLALPGLEDLRTERKALKPGRPAEGEAVTSAEREYARALRVLTGGREEGLPATQPEQRPAAAERPGPPAAEQEGVADEEPPVDGEKVASDADEEADESLARGVYARETVHAVRHRLTITSGRGDVDLIALHRALSRLSGVDEVMLRSFGDGRAVVELATRETDNGSELDARIVDALREEFDIVFKRGGEFVVQASTRADAAAEGTADRESA